MGYRVRVVNMVPHSRSIETNQDSEPSIAVHPHDPDVLAGTAFTPNPTAGPNAPYYVSTDRGENWSLTTALPGAGPFGTDDITMSYDGSGHFLYAGYLLGTTVALNVDRTPNVTGPWTVLEGRGSEDQPFTKGFTVRHGPDAGQDRLYVGNNDFAQPGGRTATVDVSLDAGATTPTFKSVQVESRSTSGQNGPQVRPTVHSDGTIYATFFGWRSSGATITTDVVVVRDDDWGKGGSPFTALVDPGDGKSGFRVAKGVQIIFNDFLAQERNAGNLAIAVDQTDSSRVYLAWCDGLVGSGTFKLHVKRSDDRGNTWSSTDLFSEPNATNVSVAVNRRGDVGLLYQQLVGSSGSQRWESHLRISRDHGHHWHDHLLATVPANVPAKTFDPYIGDYANLVAREDDFYGIFCANNTPDLANFPHGVRYQRNHDFATKQLFDLSSNPVSISIDPFFVHLRHEEEELERWHEGEHGEEIRVRGLKLERIEVEELVIRR